MHAHRETYYHILASLSPLLCRRVFVVVQVLGIDDVAQRSHTTIFTDAQVPYVNLDSPMHREVILSYSPNAHKESYYDIRAACICIPHSSNSVLLLCQVLGIDDVIGFEYFEAPSQEQLQEALLLLHSLGALDDDGKVGTLYIYIHIYIYIYTYIYIYIYVYTMYTIYIYKSSYEYSIYTHIRAAPGGTSAPALPGGTRRRRQGRDYIYTI
jgi:hypothetical protein